MNAIHALVPWEPSFVLAFTAIAILTLYVRGCQHIPVALWQKILFGLGFAVLYAATLTQFDYYAEHEFFMHRLQHTLLHHIGPILIILSEPAAPLTAGSPRRLRIYLRKVSHARVMRILMNPAVVTSLFVGLIYFWLIPDVHFIAMLDWRLYRIMNWGMILNGLMFWGLALGPSYRLPPLSTGGRIAIMLTVLPPQIIIGAVIFYASQDLYPLYTLCGRAFGGVSAMADQQIGGLILWIMGSMMSVVGILIVAFRELHNLSQRSSKTSVLLLEYRA